MFPFDDVIMAFLSTALVTIAHFGDTSVPVSPLGKKTADKYKIMEVQPAYIHG